MRNRTQDRAPSSELRYQRELAADYTDYCEACTRLLRKIESALHLERPTQLGVAAQAMVDASLRHESDAVAGLAIQIEAAAMRSDLAQVARLLPELGARVKNL